MKNRNILVGGFSLLVLVAVVAIWAGYGGPEEPATAEVPVIHSAQQPAMMTYIDPATGERIAAPAGEPGIQFGDAVNTSFDEVQLQQSPVPGGGEGFDTSGRFQNTIIVTTESESVTVECVPVEKAAATTEGGSH